MRDAGEGEDVSNGAQGLVHAGAEGLARLVQGHPGSGSA